MEVLVYDPQGAFSKMLQKSDLSYGEFHVSKDLTDVNFDENDYVAVVFFAYSAGDLLSLLGVYKRNIPIILCSLDKEVYKKAQGVYGVISVDMTKHKSEIIEYFNSILSVTV
ncbi:hypothetical protein [Joostella sp.]|uniref:hypothetical protein n=1 Tax=Joostella sp. TaxID=2231138 RepID=UPI003A8EA4BF